MKRWLSAMISVAILVTSLGLENFSMTAQAVTTFTTIYFKDDTAQHWIANDKAVIELVDNTYGHTKYTMKKVNSTTWSAKVPTTVFNITFNRLSPENGKQWNSWSAGGRGTSQKDKSTWSSTYHATVPEHGYWDGTPEYIEGFHEGDVVYLDYYEFQSWEIANALFYVNFTNATNTDKNGQNVKLSEADKEKYNPILLSDEIEDMVFTYTVTAKDEGATELRFWRGNDSELWNPSVELKYMDYQNGNNCVKVQGWKETGYVCPYVPRRHVPAIDSTKLEILGNKKVNRKVTIDLDIQGETEYLNLDGTKIKIEGLDSNGEVISDDEENYLAYDLDVNEWNHRELVFKKSGSYKVSTITYSNDKVDSYRTEEIINVVDDNAPVAGIKLTNTDGTGGDMNKNVFVRNEEGRLNLKIEDQSISENNDEIISREYTIYYDKNDDGTYSENEIINTTTENKTEFELTLKKIGKYQIVQIVKETFLDTIPELITEEDYLTGKLITEFEIVNQAPISSMSVKKSKIADIIFTVGNADSKLLEEYAAITEEIKSRLNELDIEANVSTVATSALTATDTFAWKEYDHYNYKDYYLPTLDKHITYDEKDIKMVGYSRTAMKDFLYVPDNDSSKKIFEFDLQRDRTNWHSMEGGGFLFNTLVSEEDNYIQGYCVLLTQSGLQLIQMNKTDLSSFRNGSYNRVYNVGKLLKTFSMNNLYDMHHWKIIIEKNVITVYDNDQLLVDNYVLPDDGLEAYGYGPITSHVSHSCSQQSYFTFKNIVMQTITGESLSDVVNNHEWTPGDNHYVVNFSETSVPELSDNDRMSDVTAALISNNSSFYGIGNEITMNQYNALLNSIDGMGENIQLVECSDEDEESGQTKVTVQLAVNQIVSQIIADINSKDYEIKDVISSDEKVEYTDTYFDFDGDEKGEEIWTYVYDSSVFGESDAEVQTLSFNKPIEMFTNTGAYTITHKVSDNLVEEDDEQSGFSLWSNEDDYEKLILSQHRPVAEITVSMSQVKNDKTTCRVNVQYSAYDEDHPTDAKKGIRKEEFYYKQINDTDWTEGRFPTSISMGTTYLIKYVVTDVEGTKSRPSVATVKTNEAREYVQPTDSNSPTVNISVSDDVVEVGNKFYVEASAEDDYGVVDFAITHGEEEIGTTYGRFECVAKEAGEYTITVSATDIGGNRTMETKKVTIIDNTDVIPPTVDIVSPVSGSISGSTDIIGTIKDNEKLKKYTVTRTTVSVVDNEKNIDDDSVVIATGTEEIVNGTIATIETEGLAAGVYCYEIVAEDVAGHSTTVACLVTVVEDSNDRTPPEANISDISLDNESNTISVYGSVSDDTAVSEYNLYLQKDESNKNLIGTGNSGVDEGILGTIDTKDLESGDYNLKLIVIDTTGNTCESSASFSYEKGTSGEEAEEIDVNSDLTAPVIIVDLKAVIDNGKLKISATGTIDDENLLSYTVITGKIDDDGNIVDGYSIAEGNTSILDSVIAEYTYDTYDIGKYGVNFSGVDKAGNIRTVKYVVTVNSKGLVEQGYSGENDQKEDDKIDKESLLTLVLSKTIADVGRDVNAYITYPKSATNVTLTADGANVNLSDRVGVITAEKPGEVKVVLHATIDGEEKTVTKTVRFFDRSDCVHPTVAFISPEDDSEISSATDIYANVYDETSLAYYTLEYKILGDDAEYIEISHGTDDVKNGKIGELDTTRLMNGCYLLRITAVDNGGNRVWTERTINVNGNLKIGNMSVGFTDINSSVAGIPLTVNRNYDSRNKSSGDFGYGWTMGIQSAKITETNPIASGYSLVQSGTRLSTSYTMEQTVCHDVIVTYGDGTSDKFELKLTPEKSALIPIREVKVNFQCITNKSVKLELAGDNQALIFGNILMLGSIDIFDNTNYILTRADGTKLYLNTEYGLTKMQDANGNTVSITKSGYKHSSGNSVLFTRDDKGRVTKGEEKNSSGEVISEITYAYNEVGDLIAVTDDASRTVSFTYDDNHNLIDIIDPLGIAVARNVYDEDGRLVETIDADGKSIIYEHDIDGRMEVVRDKMNHPTVYYYDDNGNILKTVDALGNTTENTYDEDNNVLTKKDALGFVENYSYDDKGQPTSYTDKNGQITYYTYNDLGQVTSVKNSDETINYMTYDSAGNMLSESDKAGNVISYSYDKTGNMTKETDANGNCVNYVFDKNGNIVSYTDFVGNTTSYSYDANGNEIQEKITYADTSTSYETTYEYDQYDNKTATYNNGLLVEGCTYDINGKLLEQIDQYGNKTKYEYDSLGNVKKITDSNGDTKEYKYDNNGNKISYIDKNGNVTKYTYDSLGHVTKIGYANGASEKYVYNSRGEVVTYTDKLGHVEKYAYDANGNNIKKSSDITGTTKYKYDAMNRMIEMIDANENVTRYEYDVNGNQTKIIYPDNTYEEYEYDSSLNKISYKDREGKSCKYDYDISGNLISVVDSNENVTKYEYDDAGNRLSEIDANDNKTTYTYDVNGNMISKTLPGGQSTTYYYNKDNQLDYVIDYKGNKTSCSYFSNGKLEKTECETGEYKKYEYYDDGTLKTITTENGTETYKWHDGKLVSKTDVNNENLTYTYDVDDNITSITSAEGTLCYTYDERGRLNKVTDYSGCVTSYEYDNIGNLTRESLPNGVNTEYEYNELSELTKVTTTNKNKEVISEYDYELGASGERNKVIDNDGNVTEYTYDDAYQLIEEKTTSADGKVSISQYTYDAAGNRTSISKNGTVVKYRYDNNNQLVQEGDILYTYDANGNLITKTNKNEVTTYDYNAYNQLVEVSVNGVELVEYKYDSSNNRVYKKTVESEDTFVFDTNREISQIVTKKSQTETDEDVYKYVYGDKLISQETEEQLSYYLTDGQLSIRKLIDNSGNVTDNYTYDAFGNLVSSTGTTNNEFLYTGQQYDSETGLYYLRARYMNPQSGRFISRDLYDGNVFEPKTLHKYAYVSNDPVNNYDPQGLWQQKVILGILAHRFINIKYILEHPGHDVNYDRKNAFIAGFVGTAYMRRFVDIIDYTSHEIYEIKPYDGVVDGVAQVTKYLWIINQNIQYGELFDGQNFILGETWPIPARVYEWPLGGALTVYLDSPGIIHYKLTRSTSDAYDNAFAWKMLKKPEFDVGSVAAYEVVAMLAASLPKLIAFVNRANMARAQAACFGF